jgi:transposase
MGQKVQSGEGGKTDKPKIDWKALDIVHPDAAGIDIGGSEHWVAISPDRDAEPVRRFQCFTQDLQRMADWLWGHGVRSVAMQSTGVYWIPVFEILQQRGLEVYLVNARHTKNLPGRKSDIAECQWLLKLHTFGLLNNSFQPSDEVRRARTLWRHRGGLVAQASSAIQRIQKTWTEMNIQLCNVLSDLSGASGMAILKAILAGQRDPRALAELLFVLEQEMALHHAYREQIGAWDRQLKQQLRSMAPKVDLEGPPLGPRPKGKRASGHAPKFDLRTELYRITGVDWTQVDGMDVLVAQSGIAEVGTNLDAFPTERHFASWLGLCPGNETSGGKMLNRRTPKVVNRAKTALRQAATALLRSQSYLGAQYRRLRTRLGAPKAITAMARKLACLFFRLLKQGQQYVDKGIEYYQQRHRDQQMRSLLKRAKQLGVQLILPALANQ